MNIKNKSFSATASVTVPDGGAEGVIIAQGAKFGGWALYATDGCAQFTYNVLGIKEFTTEATEPIPVGDHQVRMELATTVAGWRRAAASPSTTTAGRWGRVGSTPPSR